jgi:hypothetical protein
MAKWVRVLVVVAGLLVGSSPESAECSVCDLQEPRKCKTDADCPSLCKCWVREQLCTAYM